MNCSSFGPKTSDKKKNVQGKNTKDYFCFKKKKNNYHYI